MFPLTLLGIIVAMAAPVIAFAQGLVPTPPYYATNPNQPLAPSPQSPVQQQILENYRTQLLQTQREMLQQNPSGLSREQIEVNRQLNTYYPAYNPANPSYSAPPPPRYGLTTPYFTLARPARQICGYRDEAPAWQRSGAANSKHRRLRAWAQPQRHSKAQ